MSFLNMCMDRNENQWTGLHSEQEKLFCLGIASGWATCPLKRMLWPLLPGEVPYFRVELSRQDTSEMLTTIADTMAQMASKTETTEANDGFITLKTQTCTFCGQGGEVTMPVEAWARYQAGEHIQVAW